MGLPHFLAWMMQFVHYKGCNRCCQCIQCASTSPKPRCESDRPLLGWWFLQVVGALCVKKGPMVGPHLASQKKTPSIPNISAFPIQYDLQNSTSSSPTPAFQKIGGGWLLVLFRSFGRRLGSEQALACFPRDADDVRAAVERVWPWVPAVDVWYVQSADLTFWWPWRGHCQ